ncbi:CAP domain-containing protein [Candidatus Epulonipiscium viviparus]|uniref:CAP domain-containing protein n=1 Tax=Candidatus Epulonipiscium viviparus TaxID=420336 RepID=UPI002738167E|nr:CAP domain-containing protein [Candidatus Epulopiscium viviparus]
MRFFTKLLLAITVGSCILTIPTIAKTYSQEEIQSFLSFRPNNNTTPSAPHPDIPDDIQINDQEKEILRLVNEQRISHGLNTLDLNLPLSYIADVKSLDMQENHYFKHDSPTYGTAYNMVRHFNLTPTVVGENIAKGYTTPEDTVDAWMYSETHKANILYPSFTEIGISYLEDQNIWTQLFIN